MKKTVFITGATGNIGSKLVIDILKNEPEFNMILLIRARNHPAAVHRLIDIINTQNFDIDFHEAGKRIKILTGDITQKNLGLSDYELAEIMPAITHIIHAAAATKFQITSDNAAKINTEGTRRILKLAEKIKTYGNLEKFAYISTAYVCGNREGLIKETELAGESEFSNNYEKSKYQAEKYVREKASSLPIVILRPSIVVGDSGSGKIAGFNVLYTPINFIWSGHLKFIPGYSDIKLDVVPVDYVCDVIRAITFRSSEADGKTYHITAGSGKSLAAGAIVQKALEIQKSITGETNKVRFVSPRLLNLTRKFVSQRTTRKLDIFKLYLPYLARRCSFDDSNTRHALADLNITPPSFADYIDTVLDYYFRSQYMKKMRKVA